MRARRLRSRGAEASRTGEWREGIGKLLAAELAPARATARAYLDAVARFNRRARS
jgi:23S rRNA A2030 N6-methylase RlmJ